MSIDICQKWNLTPLLSTVRCDVSWIRKIKKKQKLIFNRFKENFFLAAELLLVDLLLKLHCKYIN